MASIGHSKNVELTGKEYERIKTANKDEEIDGIKNMQERLQTAWKCVAVNVQGLGTVHLCPDKLKELQKEAKINNLGKLHTEREFHKKSEDITQRLMEQNVDALRKLSSALKNKP